MPLLSIIVPVYKVELYLKRCVDSILNQSFKDLELILIDDGSPDSSPKICDEYALQDNRVIVIHQKNSGVSVARNKGLEIATGEWIAFCDSDDWIDNNVLVDISDEINNSEYELLQYGFRYVYPNRNINLMPDENNYDKNISKLHFCSMILKRNFLIENEIQFPEGITFAEDWYFKYKIYSCCKRIRIIKKIIYNYFCNSESVFHNIKLKNVYDEVKIIKIAENYNPNYKFALSIQKNAVKDRLLFNMHRKKEWFNTFPEENIKNIFGRGIKNFILKVLYICGVGSLLHNIKCKKK